MDKVVKTANKNTKEKSEKTKTSQTLSSKKLKEKQVEKTETKKALTENNKKQTIVTESATKSELQTIELNNAGKVVASLKKQQIDSYDELENYKRLLKKRKKRLVARLLIFMLLIIIAPILLFFTTIIIDNKSRHDFFGYNFYIVATDSMVPEINVNDGIILKNVTDIDSLKVGDDIGYVNDKGAVIIHRINGIHYSPSGDKQFITKGVNNASADQLIVEFEQVVGIKVKVLPTVGKMVVFFRSPGGIVLFVSMFIATIVGFYIAFAKSENIKYIENVE